eukprot:COSAG01_NODE_15535_length_1325_cov_1.660962_4_plen_64_part_01
MSHGGRSTSNTDPASAGGLIIIATTNQMPRPAPRAPPRPAPALAVPGWAPEPLLMMRRARAHGT